MPSPPSDDELRSALFDIRLSHPEFGVRRCVSLLIAQQPEWRISERRVRRTLQQLSSDPSSSSRSAMGVYPEDVVRPRSGPPKVGYVTRVAGIVDEAGVEDDYGTMALAEGTAVVEWLGAGGAWANVEEVRNLIVLDRTFIVGDTVSTVEDPLGGVGKVIEVIATVDAKPLPPSSRRRRSQARKQQESSPQQAARDRPRDAALEDSLAGISTDLVEPLGVREGSWLVWKASPEGTAWLGRAAIMGFVVVVELDGGCIASLPAYQDGPLDTEDEPADYYFPHWPGQRVSAPSDVWSEAEILRGEAPRGRKRRKGRVVSVQPKNVAVSWYAWCPSDARPLAVPSDWVDIADVTPLERYDKADWKPGDVALVPPAPLPRQNSNSLSAGTADPPPKRRFPLIAVDEAKAAPPPGAASARRLRAASVRCTHTKVRVRWSDGSASAAAVDALRFVPRQLLAEHEFLPGDVVAPSEDAAVGVERELGPGGMGVVQSVDLLERTCNVVWYQDLGDGGGAAETLSAYELRAHALNLHVGDAVLRAYEDANVRSTVLMVDDASRLVMPRDPYAPDPFGAAAAPAFGGDAEEYEAMQIAEAIRRSLEESGARSDEAERGDDEEGGGGGGGGGVRGVRGVGGVRGLRRPGRGLDRGRGAAAVLGRRGRRGRRRLVRHRGRRRGGVAREGEGGVAERPRGGGGPAAPAARARGALRRLRRGPRGGGVLR